MNIERLKTVREHIAEHPNEFDYNHYKEYQLDAFGEDCKTLACVAGTAVRLFDPEYFDEAVCMAPIRSKSLDVLDLDESVAKWLFEPMNAQGSIFEEAWDHEHESTAYYKAEYTLHMMEVNEALARLDWLIEHGTIDGYTSEIFVWPPKEYAQ